MRASVARGALPIVLSFASATGCRDAQRDLAPLTAPTVLSFANAAPQVASLYAAQFVGTAATGFDLNDAGDVVGWSYPDPGCGPFCLPPQEIVVWRAGSRMVLPLVAGYAAAYQFPMYINSQGLIGGFVGYPGISTHAAVWVPTGGGYTATDLGVLPGMTSADVGGLDDQGRLVGWSTAGGAIPSAAAAFMWSAATGMVNLSALGYPNERPKGVSPGGKVVTWNSWYQLGNPGSAVQLPPPPRGFYPPGNAAAVINDLGDQAHFLVSTSTQNLIYPFRLSVGGSWTQLFSAGTGHLSRAGLGSINNAKDVSLTVLSTGMIAAGPSGTAQPLTPLLSPAYAGAAVVHGGPMNASGQILAQVMIGRSQRLMKLTPVTPCGANCLISQSVAMTGQFIQDPAFPGSCFPGGKMYNIASATVTVTNEAGTPLANVQVGGRFLDDYWTNHPVTGTTSTSGVVSWNYKGLCGVGAIAFLVDALAQGTRTFDKTRGVLTNFVIPTVNPPANVPPVAVATVNCVAGRTCTFDGRGSYDPDGVIASYRWTSKQGRTVSTQATFTATFPKSGQRSITLTVTDNLGSTGSKTVSFSILP